MTVAIGYSAPDRGGKPTLRRRFARVWSALPEGGLSSSQSAHFISHLYR
jgi:hypothetical protein